MGVPFCAGPYNRSPAIWGPYSMPLTLGNFHIGLQAAGQAAKSVGVIPERARPAHASHKPRSPSEDRSAGKLIFLHSVGETTACSEQMLTAASEPALAGHECCWANNASLRV